MPHAPSSLALRRRARAVISGALAAALTLGLLAGVAPAIAAPPVRDGGGGFNGIDVSTTGASLLASGEGSVAITAVNGGGVDLYNGTAVAVLPLGVTYVAGSSRPGAPNAVGEPQVRAWTPDPAQPDQTAQVLVWSNIADLPAGGDLDLSFGVLADDELYPVGASFTVDVGVYANSDERIVPSVRIPTDGGAPAVSRATAGGDDDATLSVQALRLSKANLEAESEVYRGPANTTRYELTVTAAEEAGTTGVVVTDLVPAAFQVVDCRLGDAVIPCTREVVTVDGRVYTRITWNVGTLAAGATVKLAYSAFVGERAIVAPSGAASGAPTRPGAEGTPLENTAQVSGRYAGAVVSGGSPQMTVTDEATVRLLDIGVVKSVADGTFHAGRTTQFTLAVRTGQYTTASGVTLTDVLPDGLCPIVPAGTAVTGDWPAECPVPGGGSVTGGTMTSADAHADGTFTLTFAVPGSALAADQDAAVVYSSYMRGAYAGGVPTSTGDSVTNRVEVEGTTTPALGGTVDTGAVPSSNDSSATLTTTDLSLTKTVWSNPSRTAITGVGGAGATCAAAPSSEYAGSDGPRLQLGDLVCFRMRIDFTDGAATRDARLTDFLPAGTTMVAWATGPGNDATVTQVGSNAQWVLGDLVGGARFVASGGTVVIDLLARVTAAAENGSVDVTGNLAKLRYTDGSGAVRSARDDVDFTLAPAVPLSLEKLADGAASAPAGEGQAVPFTVAVTHDGAGESGSDYALDSVTVWDRLPAGFPCATISGAAPASASCEVAATGPNAGTAVVVWTLTGTALGPDARLTPGETITISYTVTVPSPLSISTSHENTAAVTRYTAPTTDGISGTPVAFHPTNPLGAYPDETANAPEASDSAVLELADAVVAKAVVDTGVTAPGNSATAQATIGESVDYTYSVTIPARTSVFRAVLDDGLPLGGALVQTGSPTLSASPAGTTAGVGCAADATEFRLCADGTLLFPTTWTNTSASAATFTVTLPTRIADIPVNVNGASVSNTAIFRSASVAGGTAEERDRAVATVTVVEPAPSLAKSASTATPSGGQTVTYTLTASNADGRPALHDTVVTDCVPQALVIGTLPSGVTGPVAGDGSNGCATGTQRLTWTLSGALAAGAPQSVSYTATVPANTPAGAAYRNSATLRGSSIAGSATGERTTYVATAERTVTVPSPTIVKTSSSATVVPGSTVTWTVTATIPANVRLPNAAFVDTIPAALGTAADVVAWSVTCGTGDAAWRADCVPTTRLTAGTAQAFGVGFGTIEPSAVSRTLTLVLTTRLPAATTATNAQNLTNTVQLRWNQTVKTAPTSTSATWDANRQTTAATQVRHPEVTVAKSTSAAQPQQGQVYTYSITATATAGTRNVTAYNVSIVDTVPAGVVVLDGAGEPIADGASTASGGRWSAAARTLTWTVPTLSSGAAAAVTRTYPARLDPSSSLAGTSLVNSVRPQSWASLASDGRSYGPGAAATASVTPQFPLIDATKTQVAPANPVYIGDEVTFRVELVNRGGAPASSLDVVDELPAGWTYVAGSGVVAVRGGAGAATDPVISGSTLRWADVGGSTVALANGERIVVTYRAVASSSVEVGLDVAHTNTARADDVRDATGGGSYNGGSGSYVGTTGTATARIAEADLSITKTANDDFVAGRTGTYTVTVRNDGPDPAVGVRVEDVVDAPDGVTVVGAAGAGWTCSAPAGGEIDCVRTDAAATLASGASWTLTVSVAIAADVEDGVEVPNTANVSARTEDRNAANDEDDAVGVVEAEADLVMSKTPSASSAVAGDALAWTIELRNDGPSVSRGSAAEPIRIADALPGEFDDAAVTASSPGVDCAIESGELACEVPFDLAVGQTVTVTVSGVVAADVAPGSEIVNTAEVSGVTTDPVPGNDAATSRVPTAVEELLSVDKSILAPQEVDAVPGETITYRLVVTNAGPSAARGVSVLDDLPEGVVFDSIVAGEQRWTASAAGSDVRLVRSGLLGVGESDTVDILVRVASAVTGDLVNTATVSSTWRADQDTSSVGTATSAETDLSIVKSSDVASVVAGDPAGFVYTLTVDNNGPSDAAGPVTATDLLPTGVSLLSAVDGCEVSSESGRDRVTCIKEDGLDVDEAAWVIELPVVVGSDVVDGTLRNTATVASPTPDRDPSDNASSTDVDVTTAATLRVAKDVPPTAIAGEDVEWTIVVTNDGPSDARAVSWEDVLDARLTLVSAESSTDGAVCSGTSTLVCSFGTIAAGDSVEVIVTTTVSPSVAEGTIIENVATATSTTPDPETGSPATATDDARTTVEAETALTIEKTAVADEVSAGGIAEFDIVVSNDGPSDAAASVVVTDALPEGMTFLAAATTGGPAQWSCDDAGDVVCVLELAGAPVTLVAGASAPTLRISAAVDASLSAGELVNTADAASPSSPEGARDDAAVDVVTFADLGIEKFHAPDATAVAGSPFVWTVRVTNHGPSDSVATAADPIRITDVLPEGVVFDAAATSGGVDTVCAAADGSEVECLRTSTIPAGERVLVAVPVVIDEAASGLIENTAAVSPGLTPQPADATRPDEDADQVELVETADLTLVKSVVSDEVVAGGPVEWAIEVENLGPSDSDATSARPISVVDTLPEGVTDVAASGDGWVCESADPTSDDGVQVVCLRDATLAVGPAPTITVTATLDPSFEGDLVNTAVVAPGATAQPAGGGADDSDDATVSTVARADLALTKTVAETIVAGATGVYRLQIVNLGPSDASDVTIVDMLPEGLAFVGASVVDDRHAVTCEVDPDRAADVVCAFEAPLPAGETASIDLEVSADADLQGDVVNTATVNSSTPDPVAENDSSSVTGTLAELADLAIVKESDGEAVIGETQAYTISVRNGGPSVARGIVVEDQLPDQVSLVSMTAEGWTCSAVESRITCLYDELDPGASAPAITIVATVLAEAYPSIANTATVTSATPEDDETLDDNASTVTDLVPAVSALSIRKVLIGELVAGGSADYEITVTNDGLTDDPGPVVVTDVLPRGLGFASATLDGRPLACDVTGSAVRCDVGPTAKGASHVLVISTTVDGSASGTIANSATVTSAASPATPADVASGHVTPLAATGSTLLNLLPLALALLLLGMLLLVVAARRRAIVPE